MADEPIPDETVTKVEPEPAKPAKPAKPAADPPVVEPALTAADLSKAIKDVVKDHAGDRDAALRTVMLDRDKLRDEAAELRGKLPKEGVVILDDDARALWETYQALGKPEDLTKALETGKAAGDELASLKHERFIGEVAGLVKWKPSVLADRVAATKVEVVVKDEPDPKDPKKQATLKVPHVKLDGDKTQPLASYAETHWADYLPALKVEPAKPIPPPLGSPPQGDGTPPRPKLDPKAVALRQSVNALS